MLMSIKKEGGISSLFYKLKTTTRGFIIPNVCFDAYEVKVNKDIFKYQEKVKLIC